MSNSIFVCSRSAHMLNRITDQSMKSSTSAKGYESWSTAPAPCLHTVALFSAEIDNDTKACATKIQDVPGDISSPASFCHDSSSKFCYGDDSSAPSTAPCLILSLLQQVLQMPDSTIQHPDWAQYLPFIYLCAKESLQTPSSAQALAFRSLSASLWLPSAAA
jgi:hypothetical protein